MSEHKKPRFSIAAKLPGGGKGSSQQVFAGWAGKYDDSWQLSPAQDKRRGGKAKVSIKVEWPDGSKDLIVLDPAAKASTHFVTLYDNGEDEPEGSDRAGGSDGADW